MSDTVTRSRPVPRALPAVLGSPALRLAGRRLLTAVPILLGVSILTFGVIELIPGNAAQQLLGPEATPDQIRQMEEQLGLNRPPIERYLDWLAAAVQGDLGRSLVSGQPVTDVLGSRFAVSGEIVGLAFLVSLGLAVPLALVAARWPNRLVDRVSMVVSTTGLSVANYVFALLLVLLFAVELAWFPAIGYVPPGESISGNLHAVTLPAFAIAFPLFCFYTRFLRSDLVEQMQGEDYVMTARAKGLGPWQVLLRHAFRNSAFGLITIVGLNLSALIGATVIIEQIFSLPGIGQLLLQAINTRDFVVIQACVIVFAIITVVASLVTDVLYAVLDPRIRYGSN
jgi:peptide/nickel transport system permease protein